MNTVYSRLTQINIYIYLHLSKDKYIRMCVEHMTLRKCVIGYAYSHLTKTNIYVYANSVIASNKDKHMYIRSKYKYIRICVEHLTLRKCVPFHFVVYVHAVYGKFRVFHVDST